MLIDYTLKAFVAKQWAGLLNAVACYDKVRVLRAGGAKAALLEFREHTLKQKNEYVSYSKINRHYQPSLFKGNACRYGSAAYTYVSFLWGYDDEVHHHYILLYNYLRPKEGY